MIDRHLYVDVFNIHVATYNKVDGPFQSENVSNINKCLHSLKPVTVLGPVAISSLFTLFTVVQWWAGLAESSQMLIDFLYN